MLVGTVLPLAADTNRITLDDGQLQEVATYIMSLDAAGGAPLNQVETAARAQQELPTAGCARHRVTIISVA